MSRAVAVFFYGSYMNTDVLREVELAPPSLEVARLSGWDLRIAPRANLVRSDRDSVWGVLTYATHAELARLYGHAHDVLGETYLPEAVLCETRDGRLCPALTYIATSMDPRPADAAYVDRIARPARALAFPAWYLERIESFAPA